MKTNRSMKKAKAGAKPRQNSNRGSPDPPQLSFQPTNRRRMRFHYEGTEDFKTTISSGDIFGALGAIASGENLSFDGYTIVAAARIKSVEIWAAPKSDSDSAFQSAYLEWKNGTSFSKSSRFGDASISNARPLHIFSKPPPLSVSDLWFQSLTINLFDLKLCAGAVIDVTVDYLLADVLETHKITFTQAVAIGAMWYDKLDRTTTSQIRQVDRAS